ncbi:MAG: response regulator transcription factor [Candidatus Eremiobacteraeota bacterium]|nr:response regulator transcription factor [Candidatus Eremiobacteraeota bacterium]
MKVMLVDDHPMVAAALRELLEAQGKVQIVAVETNAAQALRKLELLSLDVLVVDVSERRHGGKISYEFAGMKHDFTPSIFTHGYTADRIG